ncbi:MAG: hypothetical protein GYA24_16515 [Candidatus Lokiarchaeota archaeon]|nr:hypothetical protein [Candidatus Lokiarchaeota archaeon]
MEDSRPFWRRKPLLFTGCCALAACMAIFILLQLAMLAYPGGYDVDSNNLIDLNQATTLGGAGNGLSAGLFKAAFIILAVAGPFVLACMPRAVDDAAVNARAGRMTHFSMAWLIFHVPSCIAIACNWSLWEGNSRGGGSITYPLKTAEVLHYLALLVGFVPILITHGIAMGHSNALPHGLAAVNALFLAVHLYGSFRNSGEIVIFGMVAWYMYASLLVIVAAIKKGIVKKGPDILWRSTVEHHDDARPKVLERPKECPICHSPLAGRSRRRCHACGNAWCLNCGTWNSSDHERCMTCQFMLPSD